MRRLLLVGMALVVLASAIPVVSAEAPLLRADPARVELVAGAQFRGFLTITNTDEGAQTYALAGSSASPRVNLHFDATSVTLAGGETQRIGFLVQTHLDHPEGTFLTRFDASAAGVSSTAYLFLHVLPHEEGPLDGGQLPATDVSGIGAVITDGNVYDARVEVTNQNTTTTKEIPIRWRAPEGWTMSVMPETVTLAPGASQHILVHAEPTSRARNDSGWIQIGPAQVHTLVLVSLNVTHMNDSAIGDRVISVRIQGDVTDAIVGASASAFVNLTVTNDGAETWFGAIGTTSSTFLTTFGDPNFELAAGASETRTFEIALRSGFGPDEGAVSFRLPGAEWRVAVQPPPTPPTISPPTTPTVASPTSPTSPISPPVAVPPTPSAPDAATIEIELDRSTLALEPGQRGMVRARIMNRGTDGWVGELRATPSAGLQANGEMGPFAVAAGKDQSVDVFVTLATATEGTVRFTAGPAVATLRIEPPVGNAAPGTDAAAARGIEPGVAVALGAGGVAVAAGAAAAAPRKWPLAFAGLYARLAGSRLLEHPARSRIRALVEAAPGITYNEIGRQLGLERGVLDHHLSKLTSNGLVSSVPDGQYRRFYAPGSSHPVVRGALDARILAIVRERGETRASEVAATLGVSRQAMHYHLRRMVREGSIVANRGAGGLVLRASA